MASLKRALHSATAAVLVFSGVMAPGWVGAPAAAAAAAKPPAAAAAVADPAATVNPFIGTAANGNTFPGADAPFGMVQWSPDTTSRPYGGGYAYSDSAITGFSLTHISGPGCAGAGDVPILPETGAINSGATDSFSHSNESASAGYYSVKANSGIRTELTATQRSGMGRFTFPATTQADLVFKLNGSANGTSATSWIVNSNTEVSGSVSSGGFCGAAAKYTVYFDMVFDQPFKTSGTAASVATRARPPAVQKLHGIQPNRPAFRAQAVGPNSGYVVFDTTINQVVQAKVGLSFVSVSGAKANAAAENSGWDFNATHTAAHNAWNSLLGKIQVSGGTSDQQVSFYTALYHSLLYPMVWSDTDRNYTGVDGKVHTVGTGHTAEYTTFSGWDTYRTQSQLAGLLAPAESSDTVQSMLDDYAQSGMLPKWDLNNGETYVMVGDPADPIIAGYYAFGARNFDTATALKDMIAQADNPGNIRPGLNYLKQLGFLPMGGSYGCCNYYGPASSTLEYNSADASIAAFAGALGDTANQQTFINRAQSWRNLFNYGSGYIQSRDVSGSWSGGFNAGTNSNGAFVEGTGYQYTAMVPFNLRGLADAKGGNTAMAGFLDTITQSLIGANGYADMTNQPSMDIPWEYDYAGQPYKTQKVVRQVQDQLWSNSPGGLAPGNAAANDDLGSESAWYVWSMLGMYPETPGTADLALGSPMFPQAVITLPSGNTLTINGNGAADNAPYVQSATWNGNSWDNAYAPTDAITAGGTLTYTLGTSPNPSWASGASSAPPSYQGSVTYTNTGISSDSAQSAANFDGGGYSYSANALSAAGVTPGSTITTNGIPFTWPNVPAGQADNYFANGQTIPLNGSGSISFLGSSNNGPNTGTATVHYTDNTAQSIPLIFSDWTLSGGSASVSTGNTIAATTTYRNSAGGTSQTLKTYLFATTPVALASGKTVASVQLPSDVNTGGMHIFAVATGSVAGVHAGPIVSGLSSTLCVDDYHSQTSNGNPIQTWTCNGSAAQNWTVNSNGSITVFGKCMDVSGSGTSNGTQVQLWDCNGTGAQVWQSGANGSLVNPHSGKCLDVPNSSTSPGTQLQIYTCNGSNAQRWNLTTALRALLKKKV